MNLRECYKLETNAFRFCPPRCFELSGKTFEFLMDDGYDMVLCFDEKNVAWNYVNKEPSTPQTDKYECRKVDDTTYFVTYNIHDSEIRENIVFVIDLEQMLVTYMSSKIGLNPRWPYLLKTEFVFGAIKQEGVPYKHYPRHCFTSGCC